MSIEDDLQAVKRVLIDYPKMYEQKKDELRNCECERQDLLHVLELGKLKCCSTIQINEAVKNSPGKT